MSIVRNELVPETVVITASASLILHASASVIGKVTIVNFGNAVAIAATMATVLMEHVIA